MPNEEELALIYDATKNKLFSAEAAFDLIEINDLAIKNILSNILYMGIPEKTAGILATYKNTPKGNDK